MRHPISLAVFLSLLLAITASMFGQNRPGRLTVAVTDPMGSVVLGATVIAEAPNFRRSVTTNDDGIAEFRDIPVSGVKITVTASGFKPFTKQEIRPSSGSGERIAVVLEIAEVETTVEVDEKKGIDVDSYDVRSSIPPELLIDLPDDPQMLERVIQRLAGDSATGDAMPITVNGMPGAPMPSKQDIKMIRINRNIFSAQYEGTFGGGIEVFTNSSAKKISGWVSFGVRDSRLGAANPFLGARLPSQSRNWTTSFSGPLGRKAKLTSYCYGTINDSDTLINAVILDASLRSTELRRTSDADTTWSYCSLSLDADVTKRHKLAIQSSINFSNNPNAGIGGSSLETRADQSKSRDFYLGISDTFVIDPNTVNTMRFLIRQNTSSLKARSSEPSLTVTEAFLGGGSQNDRSTANTRFEFYEDATKKAGRFSLGFGGSLRGYFAGENSRSNFGGSYVFSGRTAPVLDANDQPVRDAQGNFVTTQISSIESYRRTLLFRSQGLSRAQIRQLGGGPDQFTIAGGEPEIDIRQIDFSVYQQNSYGLSDTLGLSFGVRYENQTNIDSRFNLAPRVGLIWSPKEKDKQKPITTLPRVTIGFGLFYSRFPISSVLAAQLANASGRSFYFITDPAVLDLFPAVPAISALEAASTPRSQRLIDDGLQSRRQTIANISISKKLFAGLTANLSYNHIEGSRVAVTRNINAPLPGSATFPFGNSSKVYSTDSIGRERSDRIGFSLGFPQYKLFGKTMFVAANYSYARSRNNTVEGSSSPIDPYDFSDEWGPSPFDGVHTTNGWISLPMPWDIYLQLDAYIQSGTRYNIVTGRDTNRDGFYLERPAYARDPNKPGVIATPFGLLDPNPQPGDTLIPRNIGRGRLSRDINFSFSKAFGFNRDKANKNEPRQSLRFSVNVSNVFNISNKGNPVGNMSSPRFLTTNSGFSWDGSSFSAGNPRQVSLSTGFSF